MGRAIDVSRAIAGEIRSDPATRDEAIACRLRHRGRQQAAYRRSEPARSNAKLLADNTHTLDHVLKLLLGRPAGGLAEAAVGSEGETVGRSVLEAEACAVG